MIECRDWSCSECGSGWLEDVGQVDVLPNEPSYYCPDCKKWTKFGWVIREVSDPDEELSEPSEVCELCNVLKLEGDACRCDDGVGADLDAQDPKWGGFKI